MAILISSRASFTERWLVSLTWNTILSSQNFQEVQRGEPPAGFVFRFWVDHALGSPLLSGLVLRNRLVARTLV
jgi:hypothetical protein